MIFAFTGRLKTQAGIEEWGGRSNGSSFGVLSKEEFGLSENLLGRDLRVYCYSMAV